MYLGISAGSAPTLVTHPIFIQNIVSGPRAGIILNMFFRLEGISADPILPEDKQSDFHISFPKTQTLGFAL